MKNPTENIQYDDYLIGNFVRILKVAKTRIVNVILNNEPVIEIRPFKEGVDEPVLAEKCFEIKKHQRALVNPEDIPLLISAVIKNRQRFLFTFEVDGKSILMQPLNIVESQPGEDEKLTDESEYSSRYIISSQQLSEEIIENLYLKNSAFLIIGPKNSVNHLTPSAKIAADHEISIEEFLKNYSSYAKLASSGKIMAIKKNGSIIAVLSSANK